MNEFFILFNHRGSVTRLPDGGLAEWREGMAILEALDYGSTHGGHFQQTRHPGSCLYHFIVVPYSAAVLYDPLEGEAVEQVGDFMAGFKIFQSPQKVR